MLTNIFAHLLFCLQYIIVDMKIILSTQRSSGIPLLKCLKISQIHQLTGVVTAFTNESLFDCNTTAHA